MKKDIDQIAALLLEAKSSLFITGAGVSADSGLPTYRGVGGLYEHDATEDGIPVEVALSGQMLKTDPEIAWRHIHHIEEACRAAKFNRAHEIMARLERRLERGVVLTQNVDGFHRAAGSQHVIDIHGDIHGLLCTSCGDEQRVENYAHLELPPRCGLCNHVLRPDVVLFGELLPPQKVVQLQEEIARGFDIVFTVGTTSLFPYIAEPVLIAKRQRVPTVEINPGVTEVSDVVDFKLPMSSVEAMEAIWSRYCAGLPN